MSRLKDKVALITGASSGLGRAIAARFAKEGARLILGDIDDAGGLATIAALPEAARANAHFRKLDVTSEADNEGAVADALSRFGKLDILVASAGIGIIGSVAELTQEQFERVISVNLTGVFLGAKYAFRAMKKDGGVMLALSSVAGLEGTPMIGGYGAAKAGVVQLMKTLALEGAKYRIRANVLCPAWTETPMVDAFVKSMGVDPDVGRQRLVQGIPLGRLGQPDDVANAALYLCSDEASFITGVMMPIDGGHTAGPLNR
jgi:NAD(P)-dependent dehydrogenase (short-subunit alcohol dehydrogenase family)